VKEASREVGAHSGAGEAGSRRAPSPVEAHGHWCWSETLGTAQVSFFGKAVEGSRGDPEASLLPHGLGLATLRQIHSARVVEAAPGPCGDADALVTRRTDLALRVVTADCVPVLLAAPGALAAVHAGWRGLAGGIVTAAVNQLGTKHPIEAVIGPAIGGCCYEVGWEVADRVARSAGSEGVVLQRGAGERPYLDLQLAARLELERAGVADVVTISACTRCEEARLWSYRRDGKGAGRNVALIWREPERPL
jgi:polyphenol oxidase